MNAFRYEITSLIAADPRLTSLSTQFTTGSAPFPAIRVGVLCLTVATPPSVLPLPVVAVARRGSRR